MNMKIFGILAVFLLMMCSISSVMAVEHKESITFTNWANMMGIEYEPFESEKMFISNHYNEYLDWCFEHDVEPVRISMKEMESP